MKFIKVPIILKPQEQVELERLGVDTDGQGIHTYTYLNVSELSVGPYYEEETGEIDPTRCALVSVQGRVVHTLNMSPIQYIHSVEGRIVNVG